MIAYKTLDCSQSPFFFVRWSGSNADLVTHVALKTYWLFVFVSSNILQDLLLLYDFSISNLFPITLVKQSIEKWIFRFHVLHEIEFANKKKFLLNSSLYFFVHKIMIASWFWWKIKLG